MLTKILSKRIALVAVAALAVTGLSTVSANADNFATGDIFQCETANLSNSSPNCAAGVGNRITISNNALTESSATAYATAGAVASIDDATTYYISFTGATLVSVDDGAGGVAVTDLTWGGTSDADGYVEFVTDHDGTDNNEVIAAGDFGVTLTRATAGTALVELFYFAAGGVKTVIEEHTLTWAASGSNYNISASKSSLYVDANDGDCATPGASKSADDVIVAAAKTSRTGVNTAVDICIIPRDGNDNLVTIAAATVVTSTFGRNADTPTAEGNGEYRLDLAAANGLLSGTETLTAVIIDSNGNSVVMSTTLSVYGSLKKIELSAARGSAYAAADQSTTDIDTFAEFAAATGTDRVLVVGIKATDANSATIDLNAAGVAAANSITTSNWTVDSDKIAGAPADRTSQTLGSTINDLAPENELSSSRYGSFNVQYIVCGTKPEKLTLTAWGKDSDGAWLKSNSLDVYCSGSVDKVEVTTTAQTVNVKVTDANGYPVAEGTSVTLAASNGSVVAPTSKNTSVGGTFAVPATFIASSTAASSQVTAIVGSKSGTSANIAGTGTSSNDAIATSISALNAKIVALNALIAKIMKRLNIR